MGNPTTNNNLIKSADINVTAREIDFEIGRAHV